MCLDMNHIYEIFTGRYHPSPDITRFFEKEEEREREREKKKKKRGEGDLGTSTLDC
jgi:hypothetical protein